jgi:hypothetical protein
MALIRRQIPHHQRAAGLLFLRGDREERRQDFAAWVLKPPPQLWAITALEAHVMQELPIAACGGELAGELPEDDAATVRILNVLQAVARRRCEGRQRIRSHWRRVRETDYRTYSLLFPGGHCLRIAPRGQ